MRIDQIELTGSLSISASLATNPLVVNEDYLFVSNTGNVGIGTKTPTSKLVVTGSVAVRGGLRATTLSGSFTGSIKLPNIPLGTSETNIVLVNGGGGLVYRSNLSLTGPQGNQGATGTGTTGAQGATGANAGITSYTNPSNNRVITSVSSTEINAEANLTFDGSILDVNTTSAIKMPVGTNVQRPLTPSVGMFRYNSTSGNFEFWYGSEWREIAIKAKTIEVDYLVVAGGGGSGGYFTGGGGAGGLRQGSMSLLDSTSTYELNVGAGGALSTNGSNSKLNIISSTGGGRGNTWDGSNGTGFSGGSGGGASLNFAAGGSGNAGSYSPVEGYAGGSGGKLAGGESTGGGGGAGGVGGNALSNSSGGSGGIGATSTLINTLAIASGLGELSSGNYYFAGGGGGGGTNTGGGVKGLGGGGVGGYYNNTNGGNGSVNLGGGGGGSALTNAGVGGSGVVILSYPNTYLSLQNIHQSHICNGQAAGTTIAPAPLTTRVGYKTYVFTAGSGNISW
jgi:hypothetical protein